MVIAKVVGEDESGVRMQAAEQSSKRRSRSTALALGAAGVGALTLAGGVWLLRAPLAELAIKQWAASRGVAADLEITALDFGGARFRALQAGPAAAPDLEIRSGALTLSWRGLRPALDHIELIAPRLRGRLTPEGVSLGSLDRLLPSPSPGEGTGPPPELSLRIRDGEFAAATPAGTLTLQVQSRGRLRRDFTAEGGWRLAGDVGAAEGELGGRWTPLGLTASASAEAELLRTQEGGSVRTARGRLTLALPASLDRLSAQASLEAEAAALPGAAASELRGAFEGTAEGLSSAQPRWRAFGRIAADFLSGAGLEAGPGSLEASLSGAGETAEGALSLRVRNGKSFGLRLQETTLSGPLRITSLSRPAFSFEPALRAEAALTPQGRQALEAALAPLAGGPLAPLAAALRGGAAQAGRSLSLRADAVLEGTDGAFSLAVRAPVEIAGAGGARFVLAPGTAGLTASTDGRLAGDAIATLAGPGLPQIEARLGSLSREPGGPLQLTGALSSAWTAPGAALRLAPTRILLEAGAEGGSLRLSGGAVQLDAEGALTLRELAAPLELVAAWGESTEVRLAQPCQTLRLQGLEAEGLRLEPIAAELCAPAGLLFEQMKGEPARGGFQLRPLRVRGVRAGEPLSLDVAELEGRWSGQTPLLTFATAGAKLQEGEALHASLGPIDGALRLGAAISAAGRLRGGQARIADAPTRLSGLRFDWSWTPQAGARLRRGEALLEAIDPGEGGVRVHEPVQLEALQLEWRGAQITGQGAVRLAPDGAQLGALSLSHDLGTRSGRLRFATDALAFSSALQPYDITRQLFGVLELARGAVEAEGELAWSDAGLESWAAVAARNLSFSTLALGPIEGVEGVILFDDLLALTTPPEQLVTVRKINPGIPVERGAFTFQLLPELQLALTRAEWPYAGGRLSLDPTIIQLGGEVTRFVLRLEAVDLSALLKQLELDESIRATGTVEGAFPMVFTPAGGRIEGGVLRALGDGLIAMQSPAIDETVARGTAQAAGSGVGLLQALQGFQYEELALLNLEGEIDGDLEATLGFSGENVAPVDLPTPGGQDLIGLPYRFRVVLKAPLTQLVRSAQGALDLGLTLETAEQLSRQNPN